MFIDSHCHIDFPDLAENLDELLLNMRKNQVTHALCVSIDLPHFPRVRALAEKYENIFASVGVHPDYEDQAELHANYIADLANHPKVIAIGETGLDYFRLQGDMEWQRERFRQHIRAACKTKKPLIIHTRSAATDTLRIMQEENADHVGGVMHCFTESWEIAQQAIAMNFYISFSGILTFKNATALKEIAKNIQLDRILIETDSPYLAPVPFRGKQNQPAFVRHVAEEIARIRSAKLEEIAVATTDNFFNCFKVSRDGLQTN